MFHTAQILQPAHSWTPAQRSTWSQRSVCWGVEPLRSQTESAWGWRHQPGPERRYQWACDACWSSLPVVWERRSASAANYNNVRWLKHKKKKKAPHLLHGVVVDINDFVQVLHNDFCNRGQLLEVKISLWGDVHVKCNWCQVANSHLQESVWSFMNALIKSNKLDYICILHSLPHPYWCTLQSLCTSYCIWWCPGSAGCSCGCRHPCRACRVCQSQSETQWWHTTPAGPSPHA